MVHFMYLFNYDEVYTFSKFSLSLFMAPSIQQGIEIILKLNLHTIHLSLHPHKCVFRCYRLFLPLSKAYDAILFQEILQSFCQQKVFLDNIMANLSTEFTKALDIIKSGYNHTTYI